MIATLITFLSTIALLYWDYQKKINNVKDNFIFISDSYISSITDSLWDFDEYNVRMQLKGILKLSGIHFCSILDDEGIFGSDISEGDPELSRELTRRYPLNYRNNHIGTLIVAGNFDHINSDLLRTSIVIFVSSGLLVMICSMIIMFLNNNILFRHFSVISNYTEKLNLNHLDKPLVLKRKEKQDELTQIVNAINGMRLRIRHDMEERQSMQEQLEYSHNVLKAQQEASWEGILVVDEKGHVLSRNQKFNEIWQFDASMAETDSDDLLIQHVLSLLKDPEKFQARIKYLYENKNEKSEDIIPFKDGRMIERRSSPIYGEGQTYFGRVWYFRDISQQLEAENEKRELDLRLQQAQKMESIGSLAGGIAHDFNNILFPIMGMAELLLDDLTPGSREYDNAHEILSAGKRASELVKQILAFSRQTEHKLLPTKIQQVLKEAIKLSRSTIPANIEIHKDIDQNCGSVNADSTQIHQIAMNLITNAYHAVSLSGGRINISLSQQQPTSRDLAGSSLHPGSYAVLIVSDNGTGMTPATLKKIFEPYFTTKEQGKGTGMGLSVVYGIVQEHKGHIRVTSEVGQGTEVRVFFPIFKTGTDFSKEHEQKRISGGTENILVVDDEKAVARLEGQMLSRLGYKVTIETESLNALDKIKTDPKHFDLVITDMTMPNMTGDELARRILVCNPAMPIIICTGFSERMDTLKAKEMGLKGLLMKPVVKSDMANKVRDVLNLSKTQY